MNGNKTTIFLGCVLLFFVGRFFILQLKTKEGEKKNESINRNKKSREGERGFHSA